jgi:hypothetical protein
MCCIMSHFFVVVVSDRLIAAASYNALLCACGVVGLLVAMVDSCFFVIDRAPDVGGHCGCIVVVELVMYVVLSATP